MGIIIKSAQEIALMREAGRIVGALLEVLSRETRPGMKTKELDSIVARELARSGAISSFKGYRGFPANLCVSVNDEVVHGIPGERVLKEGDVVSLDVGAIYKGFQGDGAITLALGEVEPQARELIEATRQALLAGISAARAGASLGDVSSAIQTYVEARGFSVIREYTGHGIGREMHEEPQVPNFGVPGQGPRLRQGMALALEPMVAAGDWKTRVGENNWTVYTKDGSLAAHFEHTIAITDGEAEVLTAL